jgi:hypothetical protein
MNRMIGRFLILGVVGLAASLCDQSTARADWPWGGCCGYRGYTYGAGYYPYSLGSFSGGYWPSSYYAGYPTWGSYYGGGCCGTSGCGTCGGCGSGCGGSCWGGSCCATSGCGSSCCGVTGGCGSLGCGSYGCGGCSSGCGLACGSDCSGGCGVAGSGCGAVTTPPGTKPKPVPDGEFQPRTYDPGAPTPAERTPRRGPRPDSGDGGPAPLPGGAGGAGPAGPPAAGMDAEPGAGKPYTRERSGDGTKPPAGKAPADGFESPAASPATKSPSSTTPPKDGDVPFETKKPLAPIPQRDTKKKAPVTAPDDSPSADAGSSKPALTLQDRMTWHLTGVSRPTFGEIARRSAPVPERLTPSTSDWAVLSSDRTDIVRR